MPLVGIDISKTASRERVRDVEDPLPDARVFGLNCLV